MIGSKFLPDAKLIGWDFADAKLPLPSSGPVYVLDLPPDCLDVPVDAINNQGRLVWIDHHKSAIEKFSPNIPGYRIDGVAACRLAWQWFNDEPPNFAKRGGDQRTMPSKDDFVERRVNEPLAVRLAGEYDVWCHEPSGGDDIVFQFGLDAYGCIDWDELLQGQEHSADVHRILNAGLFAMACYKKRDADIMRERSFIVEWEGLKFLAITTARCNSQTFAARDVPETGHDALMGFFYNGRAWTVSLYHAKHRTDIDLSQIAVKHGGGGHAGACGCMFTKTPPFLECH